MKLAYVDTSCLIAVAFGEAGAAALARRLAKFDVLAASDLLEAELRSAFLREGVEPEPELLAAVSWVLPDRPLHAEIERVLAAGYVRGADCWHLATALYLAEDPSGITFLTLDERQAAVAKALGFRA
jgi:predicted nucleic acid-binding protein